MSFAAPLLKPRSRSDYVMSPELPGHVPAHHNLRLLERSEVLNSYLSIVRKPQSILPK